MNRLKDFITYTGARALLYASMAIAAVAGPTGARAQPPDPTSAELKNSTKRPTALEIAKSSDLSTALPPGRWRELNASVDHGLAWLASEQLDDGRFPGPDTAQPAITCFATMAFLSRGHIPDHGKYGPAITRAINFTLKTQKQPGYFSFVPVRENTTGHLSPGQTAHYNHAIAGLMLGEAYGMTRGSLSKRIGPAIQRALAYSRAIQTRPKQHPADLGGFRYLKPATPNASSDLSVTGWQLMFLRSARNAEFEVPKLYFDEGLEFVERCEVPKEGDDTKGTFGYRPPATGNNRATLANTGSAMLALMMGGRHDRPCVQRGIQWYVGRSYPRPWESSSHYYLATYYSSQAMAQAGGRAWNVVFPQIAKHLMDEQLDTGGWPPGGGVEGKLGDAYSTSMAVLALTPPLQLLPIYQR